MSYYNTTGAKRALFGIAIYSAFGQYLFGSSSNPIAISKKGGKVCLSINKCCPAFAAGKPGGYQTHSLVSVLPFGNFNPFLL